MLVNHINIWFFIHKKLNVFDYLSYTQILQNRHFAIQTGFYKAKPVSAVLYADIGVSYRLFYGLLNNVFGYKYRAHLCRGF